MIRKYFNEEVKASDKNCKVNGSDVCFLYTFFLCSFIVEGYCFNHLFSSGKERLLGGCEKNWLFNGVENGLACHRHCSK